MKTNDLTGAELDYWTARAEGIPAEQLTIRRVQRSTEYHVVRNWKSDHGSWQDDVLRYSTDWAQGGPLIEKYGFDLIRSIATGAAYHVLPRHPNHWSQGGDTPLQAICRAVVRAAFDEEVDEISV